MATLYKVEVVIFDYEDIGEDKMRELLEKGGAIKLRVKKMQSQKMKKWYDLYPMNKTPNPDSDAFPKRRLHTGKEVKFVAGG